RRRHTRSKRDWSSDVCSSDLVTMNKGLIAILAGLTIVILLLANNNATVRDEKEEAKANIEDMEQEMQAMQNNQTVEQSQDKQEEDRKSTRLNSSHVSSSYAVF